MSIMVKFSSQQAFCASGVEESQEQRTRSPKGKDEMDGILVQTDVYGESSESSVTGKAATKSSSRRSIRSSASSSLELISSLTAKPGAAERPLASSDRSMKKPCSRSSSSLIGAKAAIASRTELDTTSSTSRNSVFFWKNLWRTAWSLDRTAFLMGSGSKLSGHKRFSRMRMSFLMARKVKIIV